MELSSQAQQFFVDRFGYNPEAVNITRPDGVNDTAYLIGGREGFQPWPAKQVEAYVLYMQGGLASIDARSASDLYMQGGK